MYYSFYCIVLLTTLFISSCYWQPFPLDTPLSHPWSENITTFADALNSTLMSNYSQPLPKVIRAVDRCWCDFSSTGFFDPFNVSRWESLSVTKLKDELEQQQKKADEALLTVSEYRVATETIPNMPRTSPPSSKPGPTESAFQAFWSLLKPRRPQQPEAIPAASSSSLSDEVLSPLPVHETTVTFPDLPLIRKEYDLRHYGLAVIVDFSWNR